MKIVFFHTKSTNYCEWLVAQLLSNAVASCFGLLVMVISIIFLIDSLMPGDFLLAKNGFPDKDFKPLRLTCVSIVKKCVRGYLLFRSYSYCHIVNLKKCEQFRSLK